MIVINQLADVLPSQDDVSPPLLSQRGIKQEHHPIQIKRQGYLLAQTMVGKQNVMEKRMCNLSDIDGQ